MNNDKPDWCSCHISAPCSFCTWDADHDIDDILGDDTPTVLPEPICTGCNKRPADIPEYIELAEEIETDADTAVRKEEGTYNPSNGHFLCTACYVAAGCPSLPSPQRWIAP